MGFEYFLVVLSFGVCSIISSFSTCLLTVSGWIFTLDLSIHASGPQAGK